MEKRTDNKRRHIVVSGGSRGVGLEICRALLEDGYNVSAFSRGRTDDIDDLVARFGADRLLFEEADISSSQATNKFVDHAVAAAGSIYGLVNNAAVARDGIFASLPEVEISRMIACNLEGTLFLTRHCLRNMLTGTSGGRLVNISSIVGSRGYNGLAVYSATKAALDGFTRSISRELGRRGITVNSIGPGYMKTAMSAGIEDTGLEQIVRRTPMGRLAEPGDITPLLLFLLSDQAAFITGQTILVDGGISA
jgi:3-oxoacyl-[acyl-carrier protein] reductase